MITEKVRRKLKAGSKIKVRTRANSEVYWVDAVVVSIQGKGAVVSRGAGHESSFYYWADIDPCVEDVDEAPKLKAVPDEPPADPLAGSEAMQDLTATLGMLSDVTVKLRAERQQYEQEMRTIAAQVTKLNERRQVCKAALAKIDQTMARVAAFTDEE